MKLPPLAGVRLAKNRLADAGRIMAKCQPDCPTGREDELIVESLKTLAGELNGRQL